MYAQIVFPLASFKSFTYKIPPNLQNNVFIGCCINATFRNKKIIGHILELSTNTTYTGKAHSITSICKNQFKIPIDLWKTIIWMSKYYIAPMGLCIKSAIPMHFLKNNVLQKYLGQH